MKEMFLQHPKSLRQLYNSYRKDHSKASQRQLYAYWEGLNHGASEAHGYDVWMYSCKSCKSSLSTNARFDKHPDEVFCPWCGVKLK